jgi:hypothetical protein
MGEVRKQQLSNITGLGRDMLSDFKVMENTTKNDASV